MITRKEVIESLKQSDVEQGSTIFSHSNIAFFGAVENVSNMDELCDFMMDCILHVIGPKGTLVLPTFTYSFGSDSQIHLFDVKNSRTKTSALANWLMDKNIGQRSVDPMLSVLAVGAKAELLTKDTDNICFGPSSVWARLYMEDAKLCNFNLDSGSTFLHWVEREAGVDYRHDLKMTGKIINGDSNYEKTITYTGRNLECNDTVPCFESWHKECICNDISKVVSLGRGQIVTQNFRAAKHFLESLLEIKTSEFPNFKPCYFLLVNFRCFNTATSRTFGKPPGL